MIGTMTRIIVVVLMTMLTAGPVLAVFPDEEFRPGGSEPFPRIRPVIWEIPVSLTVPDRVECTIPEVDLTLDWNDRGEGLDLLAGDGRLTAGATREQLQQFQLLGLDFLLRQEDQLLSPEFEEFLQRTQPDFYQKEDWAGWRDALLQGDDPAIAQESLIALFAFLYATFCASRLGWCNYWWRSGEAWDPYWGGDYTGYMEQCMHSVACPY